MYGRTFSNGLVGNTLTTMVSLHMLAPEERPNTTKVLFVDVVTGKNLTFKQIRTLGEQFGKGLQEKWQWRKGDVLATVSPNSIDLVPATFGALRVGGVICPLNFLYTVDELVSQLRSSKAKGLITNSACINVVREAALKVGLPLNRILLVGDADPKNTVPHFSSLRASSKIFQKVAINPKEDLAYLVYSSGTTGLPKGVMLTHANIVANSVQMVAAEGPDITHWKTDRSLGFLPMYHIYGRGVYHHHVSISAADTTRRCRPDALAT
jgi:acyl-CoA synthetase (AMP-forming)/AMP-acid ligase II